MKFFRRIIVFLLLVVFAVVTYQLLTSSRGPHPRAHCASNMSQIVYALLNYENQTGHFPPPYTVDENGRPLHSWRTLMLPFMEYNDLYEKIRFDEPWDSEYNKRFHDFDIPLLRCPNADPNRPRTSTCYDVVIGPNTAFPPSDGETQPKVSIDDILNSAGATTILLVERKMPVHWMEPNSIDIDDLANEINWRHNDSAYFSLADRSVRFLWKGISPDVLRRLCEWKGRELSECNALIRAIAENERARSAQIAEREWQGENFRRIFLYTVGGIVLFACLITVLVKRLKRGQQS
jgi:hypothetical protein